MMKRKALLIGDSGSRDSYLSGVKYDLNNYTNFLKSLRGGAWYDSEISILSNESKNTILKEINIIRDGYDLVFAVFTGHGRYDNYKQCRMLGISVDDEEISEKILWNLAPKQILILDSCSGLPNVIQESVSQEHSIKASHFMSSLARQKYEKICSQCPSQQIYLYASEMGTFANDTEKGGLYSTHLLEILINNTFKGDYLDIVSAHKNVVDKFRQTKESQEPAIKIQDGDNKLYLPGAIKDF